MIYAKKETDNCEPIQIIEMFINCYCLPRFLTDGKHAMGRADSQISISIHWGNRLIIYLYEIIDR